MHLESHLFMCAMCWASYGHINWYKPQDLDWEGKLSFAWETVRGFVVPIPTRAAGKQLLTADASIPYKISHGLSPLNGIAMNTPFLLTVCILGHSLSVTMDRLTNGSGYLFFFSVSYALTLFAEDEGKRAIFVHGWLHISAACSAWASRYREWLREPHSQSLVVRRGIRFKKV